MKKLLLESVDNESRKNAIKFLINNFERCFPLEMHDKTPEEKKRIAEEYELSVEIRFCDPWNVERACNWTKALVEGLTRILKTECNENSARPENKRMLAQMEKWEGKAKGTCTDVVRSVAGRIEVTMRNITQALIPACEACEQLDEKLTELEEMDQTLLELYAERDHAEEEMSRSF